MKKYKKNLFLSHYFTSANLLYLIKKINREKYPTQGKCRQNADKMRNVDKTSAKCKQNVDKNVDKMSTKCRQNVDKVGNVDKMSTKCRQNVNKNEECRQNVYKMSTKCRQNVKC